jgi:hypothetical protein
MTLHCLSAVGSALFLRFFLISHIFHMPHSEVVYLALASTSHEGNDPFLYPGSGKTNVTPEVQQDIVGSDLIHLFPQRAAELVSHQAMQSVGEWWCKALP